MYGAVPVRNLLGLFSALFRLCSELFMARTQHRPFAQSHEPVALLIIFSHRYLTPQKLYLDNDERHRSNTTNVFHNKTNLSNPKGYQEDTI